MSVVLDSKKLLGFRIAGIAGAAAGVKAGLKAGTKVGGKLGVKTVQA